MLIKFFPSDGTRRRLRLRGMEFCDGLAGMGFCLADVGGLHKADYSPCNKEEKSRLLADYGNVGRIIATTGVNIFSEVKGSDHA
jgi:hypothetical protein